MKLLILVDPSLDIITILGQSPWGMAMCLVLLKMVPFLLGEGQLILRGWGLAVFKINILAVKHLKINILAWVPKKINK